MWDGQEERLMSRCFWGQSKGNNQVQDDWGNPIHSPSHSLCTCGRAQPTPNELITREKCKMK